jgi:SAM-dependent methyltransferase
MPISPIPPSDEPADFRRQAGEYASYRRGYSARLYDAVTEHAGAGAGRLAVDLACGTGLVLRDLAVRGWRTLGVDLSAPMLAEVGDRGAGLVRARAEALPLRARLATLVTCGMGFHWMPAETALAEMARVVRPGGWVALFWRYPLVDQAPGRLVREVLGELGHAVPDGAFSPDLLGEQDHRDADHEATDRDRGEDPGGAHAAEPTSPAALSAGRVAPSSDRCSPTQRSASCQCSYSHSIRSRSPAGISAAGTRQTRIRIVAPTRPPAQMSLMYS